MINPNTFLKENIERIVDKYKSDYELVSRAVFALGLVEALVKVGTNFIFKGGSALMLLFKSLKRLSTDVDILVPYGYDIESYLKKASEIIPFISLEESKRQSGMAIEKKHYKIRYKSTSRETELTVIVDVLFANDVYSRKIEVPINNDLLLCEGNDYYVKVPSCESILGDKLTAFAPHTIGKSFFNEDFSNDKRLEIIKQFYDISCLFDVCKDFDELKATYVKTAQQEISYRNRIMDINESLIDTFNAALRIFSHGLFLREDYPHYISGLRRIKQHIVGEKINPESAELHAARIMFLTSCLLTSNDAFSYKVEEQSIFKESSYSKLNFLKRKNRTAFNFAATAIRLLNGIKVI